MKTHEVQFDRVQELMTSAGEDVGEFKGYSAGKKLITAGLLLSWIHTKFVAMKLISKFLTKLYGKNN